MNRMSKEDKVECLVCVAKPLVGSGAGAGESAGANTAFFLEFVADLGSNEGSNIILNYNVGV